MKRSNFPFLLLILSTSLQGFCEDSPAMDPAKKNQHILYLMKSGNLKIAMDQYLTLYEQTGKHDMDLLQEMGLSILDAGYRSRDNEIQLMTLLGAGVSFNERTFYVLEEGIHNANPQVQLIALSLLARFQDDKANRALEFAMRSDYPIIRLEAAFFMCQRRHPKAIAQTEALMNKLPPEAHALFPQLYLLVGNHEGTKITKKMLTSPISNVRVGAVDAINDAHRDDFLPQIRNLATHQDIAQQEACASTLGAFKDGASIPRLKVLMNSKSADVRLAALFALYQLGEEGTRDEIFEIARKGNLFAVSLLGDIKGSIPLLVELSQSNDFNVRINASIILLGKKDARALEPLLDVFVKDSRDLAFVRTFSHGRSLTAWKTVSSAQQNFKDNPMLAEMSLKMREGLLVQASNLEERDFLELAKALFELNQNELVPMLVKLIEDVHSDQAIELLKKYSQRAGAPLIRNYCNLALYRLKEEGPYFENLRQWIRQSQDVELIRFRPVVPNHLSHGERSHQLTPDDTSRLLIESFESFVRSQDERGIDIIFDAIKNGNEKNRYALAGLLLQTTL